MLNHILNYYRYEVNYVKVGMMILFLIALLKASEIWYLQTAEKNWVDDIYKREAEIIKLMEYRDKIDISDKDTRAKISYFLVSKDIGEKIQEYIEIRDSNMTLSMQLKDMDERLFYEIFKYKMHVALSVRTEE